MNLNHLTETDGPVEGTSSGMSRRSFFQHATIAGATGAAVLYGLAGAAAAFGQEQDAQVQSEDVKSALKTGDKNILVAAQIAEALAVTTYTNIVDTAPFFTRLPDDDRGYLYAARQEEMSHYLLEESVTDQPSPFTSFYYPKHMFTDAQTTLNTLVTLEDAFIAAYLIGVRSFSTPDLRVTAARIMGIESDHRTLARSLAGDVAPQDGGPITKITGIQGVAENVRPPNNNGYERTLCLSKIEQAVQALLPFVDKTAAAKAGFNTAKSYAFESFHPNLATPLGEFISFKGC
jgi:hypothetical protein